MIGFIGKGEQASTLQEQDRSLKIGFMNQALVVISFHYLFVSLWHVQNSPKNHCGFVESFILKTNYWLAETGFKLVTK
jgi:hypothetical protein